MLPEWKDLKKKAKKLNIPNDKFFQLADEYIHLKEKFQTEGILELLHLWTDMVFYPLYIVIQLCMLECSTMYIFSLMKAYQMWVDWFRLQELELQVQSWKDMVRSMGGPWISANDPVYHTFVYADGMERIKHSRAVRPSQKTEKMSPKAELPVQSQASSPPKSPSVPSEVPSAP